MYQEELVMKETKKARWLHTFKTNELYVNVGLATQEHG